MRIIFFVAVLLGVSVLAVRVAYLYPDMVNGEPTRGLNPFANNQDFALMYYLV